MSAHWGSFANRHGYGVVTKMPREVKANPRRFASVLAASLIFAPSVHAQCSGFPFQLTNGQMADATQVMADLNTVGNCATGTTGSIAPGSIAVFSGPNSITSGNLTGDVTTSNGTATALIPSGVAAGTYTYATVTVDAKGRVVSAANGSVAGVADYFDGLNLPVPSVGDFTVTADPSFGANYGLQAAAVGVSLFGGDTNGFAFAWADKQIPNGGTTGDFAVTALIKLAYLNTGNYAIGITLGDGTKRITWGFRNTQLWVSHTNGTNGDDSEQTFGGDIAVASSPTLYRIRKTGSTIYEEIALDGRNFDVINSEPATGYLSSNLKTFGVGILPNNTYQRIVLYGIVGQ